MKQTPLQRVVAVAPPLGHLGWVVGQVSLIAMRFENSEACGQHSTKNLENNVQDLSDFRK